VLPVDLACSKLGRLAALEAQSDRAREGMAAAGAASVTKTFGNYIHDYQGVENTRD